MKLSFFIVSKHLEFIYVIITLIFKRTVTYYFYDVNHIKYLYEN
jgi:hypothetical protein